MNKKIGPIIVILTILLSLLGSQPALAVGHPFEFTADARMNNNGDAPVEKTYGYMTLTTDQRGKGTIDVMFSNGNSSHSARFNARVKFLDAGGAVIGEEYFDHWLVAAEFDEAIEGKVTKPVTLSDFESIQVDFYLSDISSSSTVNHKGNAKVSDTTSNFEY
ncbi:MAG: hypothetical protein OES20_14530 [Gammaproteobacteria bacterium]|nr:hypothetical protein [Gammaproteobacteria bacterium]MDH3857386.1 hypothetical protein [Gammaproteobacteria bacterium]